MSRFLRALKNLFTEPLSREAFEAYFNRLPAEIGVSWFRDGNFIVGKITVGNHVFMTQGKDADDFVTMVNDAIITVFDIPPQYYDVIHQAYTYEPSAEEFAKLRNESIKNSNLSFEKNEKVAQLA